MTKIKICGITNLADAVAITKLDVDYLGFIINFPLSLRNMEPDQVSKIIQTVKQQNEIIKFVGVFVNESVDQVVKIVKECNLDVVQLHGDESKDYCTRLRLSDVEVWKGIIISDKRDIKNAKKYYNKVDHVLFDSGRGSGHLLDFSLFKDVKVDILSGGLDPDNVKEAIERLTPEIIDLNSQLESSPGKKDINLVKKAVSIIKNL